MGGKTRDQLLDELSAVQKMLEEKTEAQGQMIRKFQTLIANERLFSQIVDFFPYPIVIFTPQYTLAMTNQAFVAETKMRAMDPAKGAARILLHKIDDMRLAAAVRRVLTGDTCFLQELKNPFSMFSGMTRQDESQPDRFYKAVIFPVPADEAETTHGVIVFMP